MYIDGCRRELEFPDRKSIGRGTGMTRERSVIGRQRQDRSSPGLPLSWRVVLSQKFGGSAANRECSAYGSRNIVAFICQPTSTNEVEMQVLCKKTNGDAETHCCVCGQGFVMFWDRQSRAERIAALHEIQMVLRRHHRNSTEPDAHPSVGFTVPEWRANPVLTGVAGPETLPALDL